MGFQLSDVLNRRRDLTRSIIGLLTIILRHCSGMNLLRVGSDLSCSFLLCV